MRPSVPASLTEHRVLRVCPCVSQCQGFSLVWLRDAPVRGGTLFIHSPMMDVQVVPTSGSCESYCCELPGIVVCVNVSSFLGNK